MKLKINNWRTTLTGIVGAITLIGPELNKCLAGEPCDYSHIIMGIVVAVLGTNAKDKNVTGGSKPQTTEAENRIE